MLGVVITVNEQYPVLDIEWPTRGHQQMVLLTTEQVERYLAARAEWAQVQTMLSEVATAHHRALRVAARRAHRVAALAENREHKKAYNDRVSPTTPKEN